MHRNVLNFRNIGFFQTDEGTLKGHYFYRGGPLSGLSDETIQHLQNDLNIKTVIDFRDNHEIEWAQNHQEGFELHHLNIIADQKLGNANPEVLIEENKIDNPKYLMDRLYRNIITSKNSQNEYSKFFDIILESNDPIYFHCSAGKDRTGLGAAFLLKILGVSDEDIVADYLLTNTLSFHNIESRVNAAIENGASEAEVNKVRIFSSVDISYLQSANEEIEKHFGSFENFANQALNLNEEKIRRLKEKFIEK